MKRLLILLLALIPASTFAQGVRYDNIAIRSNGLAIAAPTVNVCTGITNPLTTCTTGNASLFSDVGLTVSQSNPTIGDNLGNYGFYIAPGNYTLTISASGISPVSFAITLSPNTTAALKPAASDAIQYVSANGNDANDGLSWGSAKATSAAAYAAEASTGGWIEVGCGTFSLSATLNLNTNNKPVKMIGSGPCTVFNYTPSTGTAILLDTGGGNPANQSVLADFTLSTSVAGSTATGLKIGSVNTAKYSIIRNVNITGFKVLADANAFGVMWEYVHLEGCSSAAGSSGVFFDTVVDDNHFTNGTIAGCSKMVDGTGASTAGPQWMQGEEFFQTASGEIAIDLANGFTLHCESCHLVAQAGTGTPDFFSLSTNAALHFTDAIFEDDNASGSYSNVAQVNGGFLSVKGAHLNFSGATSTNFVSVSGTSGVALYDVNNDGSAVTTSLVNSTFTGPLTEIGTQAFNGSARSIAVNGLNSGLIISNGTATMTTTLIAAGACGTTVTVPATGILTTDAIIFSFNAAPAANPGELVISSWPTAGNVNFQYCNPTAASVTPNAATLNWKVVR